MDDVPRLLASLHPACRSPGAALVDRTMSLCRMAPNGLYVYDDGRCIRCAWCRLDDTDSGVAFDNIAAFLAHAAEHRAAGHVVEFTDDEAIEYFEGEYG